MYFSLYVHRCVRRNTDFLPRTCIEIYAADAEAPPVNGNINESSMFPGIKRAIDQLLANTTSTSENHDSCVQLIQRYFCEYYFPLCDVDTGIITPVCSSSCNLLFNNEGCSYLLMEAIQMMQEFPVAPSGESCEETFLPLTNTPESDECVSIDGRDIASYVL